jgi:branched-chain amino acid aminotransferase
MTTVTETLPDSHSLAFRIDPAGARVPDAEREAILADPGFGLHFTDHRATVDWTDDLGWHDARVEPNAPLTLSPAAAVFHYGQEVFEGLKAYRHDDGSIWTFRPDRNAERMRRSAERLALPAVPAPVFVDAVRALVRQDAAWVPSTADTSLYLRPFVIATESFLGVRAARQAQFHVIASPAGAYFHGGVRPVTIWLSTEHSRAGVGGTGAAKTGGNYAASLLPQQIATDNGCSQVLFVDASGERIEEAGSMNIMFVLGGDTLVTPRLGGSILAGVTRESILQLARDRGLAVEERDITVSEWRRGAADGTITEVFACGTAAVITPIAALKTADGVIGDPDAPAGGLALSLRRELTDIQYGRIPDRHGWMLPLVD